jgi:MipA family protein
MHPTHRISLSLLILAAAAGPQWAGAQATCKAVSAECVRVGDLDITVSVGAGTRTNPIAGRSDIPVFVIPHVSFYGKRFFIESLEPGVTLYEAGAHTFNLIASPGYDRVFFSRSDLQNVFVSAATVGQLGGFNVLEESEAGAAVEFSGHRRHTTYLAGPEWLFSFGKVIGQLDALYEVTGRHQGYELRSAVAAPLLQSKQSLVVNGGLTWKSAKTVGYYYGVKGLYEPGAALSPFVKLSYGVPLSERWTFSAFVHYEYLDNDIVDSPIVEDRGVVTAFAGFNFKVL